MGKEILALDAELADKFKLYLQLCGKGELCAENIRKLTPQEIQYIIESPKLQRYIV